MQRREFAKSVGGIAGLATVGAGGLVAASGGAAASSFNFSASKVSAEVDDGDVEEIRMSPTGDLTWNNFDEEIVAIGITIESRVLNEDDEQVDGWKTVHTTAATEEHGGLPTGKSGSHKGKVGPGNQTLYSGSETDIFDSTADGETKTRVVEVKLTLELLANVSGAGSDAEWTNDDRADPADKAVVSDTASFKASATNLEATTSGSAEAGAEMVGDTETETEA